MAKKKQKKEVAQHPIDTRLAELGKKRAWLAERVDRSPQCIGQYCNRQRTLDPDGRLVKQICETLGVNLNYIYLGPRCGKTRKLNENEQ
jgi:hypothetical protein